MNRLGNLVPAPLAAPETRTLRAARFRVIAGCVVLTAILLFFGALREAIGSLALPLCVAVATFLALQTSHWVRAKNAADDAWLFREKDDVA